MRVLLLILIFCCFAGTFAQQSSADDNSVSTEEKLVLLNQLSKKHRENSPRQAITYAEEALKLAEELSEPEQKCFALENLFYGYYNSRDFEKSYSYAREYEKYATENSNDDKIAYGNYLLGLAYGLIDDHDEALKHFLLSLEQYEKLGKNGNGDPQNQIGIHYSKTNRHEEAIEFFKKSLHIRQKQGNQQQVANSLNNIGISYTMLGDYKQSIDYLMQSLKIKQELGLKSKLAQSYNNIANAYSGMEDFDKAEEYYQKALDLKQQFNDDYGTMISLHNIAINETKKGNHRKSLVLNLQALKISVKLGSSPEILVSIYKYISINHEGLSNYRESLQYYKKYTELQDSLANQAAKARIEELSLKYNIKEKEKEIDLLNKESVTQDKITAFVIVVVFLLLIIISVLFSRNRLKKRVNEKLEKSEQHLKELNDTKDKFFSILAHDLKNPVGAFRSVLTALNDNFDTFDKEDIKEFMHEMNESSKHLFNLLENLLEWSRAQTGRIPFNPQEVNMELLIDNNISLLEMHAAKKKIKLSKNISGNVDCTADANMISTVIRNLASNAIKFTPEGGSVQLAAHGNDEHITISVKDSGVGISPENIDKLFRLDVHHTTQGTADEKGTGLGLILCKEFVDKHSGEITVSSNPGEGTTFSFIISK